MELKELLNLLQENKMEYFDEFYEQTKKQVFYMVYSITRDYDVSEDLLQEVYLKALRYKNRINPNKNILSYLMQIAKTISLNYIKKNSRIDYVEESSFKDESSSYLDCNVTRDVKEAMAKVLNDSEYQVVILHVINELTHKEISKILNKPIGTITWMYQNAIKKIRKELGYDRKEN